MMRWVCQHWGDFGRWLPFSSLPFPTGLMGKRNDMTSGQFQLAVQHHSYSNCKQGGVIGPASCKVELRVPNLVARGQ